MSCVYISLSHCCGVIRVLNICRQSSRILVTVLVSVQMIVTRGVYCFSLMTSESWIYAFFLSISILISSVECCFTYESKRSSIQWLAGVDEYGLVVGVGRSGCFCWVEVVAFVGCLLAGIFLLCCVIGGKSSLSRGGRRCLPEGRDFGFKTACGRCNKGYGAEEVTPPKKLSLSWMSPRRSCSWHRDTPLRAPTNATLRNGTQQTRSTLHSSQK